MRIIRESLYRNLETLKVRLNFYVDFSKVQDINRKEFYTTAGGYNTRNNTLNLNPFDLKEIWKIAQIADNPNDFYWKQVSQTLLHELSHVASTRYDSDNEVVLCGFDKYPSDNECESNRGLTEGMTEVIAMTGVPNTIEISSGYYIEALFVN